MNICAHFFLGFLLESFHLSSSLGFLGDGEDLLPELLRL